jgi:hypothetical protein
MHHSDWVAAGLLALAAVAATQIVVVDAQDRPSILAKPSPRHFRSEVIMERAEEPKPPPIDGWIIVEVCSITGKLDHPFSEWAYVRPEIIVVISNPTSTPVNCVAIHSASGRRIYVQGTLAGIAALVTERSK